MKFSDKLKEFLALFVAHKIMMAAYGGAAFLIGALIF